MQTPLRRSRRETRFSQPPSRPHLRFAETSPDRFIGAWARHDDDVLRLQRLSLRRRDFHSRDFRAALVIEHANWRALRAVDPAIAPLHQRDDRGEQVAAHRGQGVVLRIAAGTPWFPAPNSGFDQLCQAIALY